MTKKKEVAIKEENQLPAFMLEDTDPTGFEDMDADDFIIPRLKLVQKGSPEVDDSNAKYIDGAKVGQMINTATQELYDSLNVIPIKFTKNVVEWGPENNLVATYEPGAVASVDGEKNGKPIQIHPETGNELVSTTYMYCLTENGPIVIPFKSTGIKVVRSWVTQARNIKGAHLYSFWWKLDVVTETSKVHSWRNYKVSKLDAVTLEQYTEAKDFLSSIEAGTHKMADEEAEPTKERKF